MESQTAQSWKRADATWFREAKWGVFTHYLADVASSTSALEMDVEAWNRRVESFDVPRYVEQLRSVGAGYNFLTLGQNSGYYCSPNRTYDDLVGERPSRLSRRDLVGDLAEACAAAGIRQMVYFTSSAPANHALAIERLGCTHPDEGVARRMGMHPEIYTVQPDVDERLTRFQRNWETIIREWSVRWGSSVHGWWIDGAYAADVLYRHEEEPNFRSFAAAVKAGNPQSLVAFNPGVRNPIISHTPYEDYTAGELNDPSIGWFEWGKGPNPFRHYAPTVNGAQYHVLIYLGEWWGQGAPRFSRDLAVAYSRHVVDHGGVITWDVPISPDGLIPPEHLETLGEINRAVS